jgi:cyanate permease
LGAIGFLPLLAYVFAAKDPIMEKKEAKAPQDEGKKREWKELFSIPETWLLALIMGCCCWIMHSLFSCVPIFLYDTGYSSSQIGLFGSAQTIGLIVAAVLGGSVSDLLSTKYKNPIKGRPLTMVIGFCVCFAGLIMLNFFTNSFLWVYSALMIAFFGVSWPQAAYWALPVEVYPPKLAGRGAGLPGSLGNLPDPIAPTITMALALSYGWSMGWSISAIVVLIGTISSFVLSKKGKTRGLVSYSS